MNDLPVAGPTHPGHGSGAELSSGKWIKEGHQRGHDVDVLVPDTFQSADEIAGYDVVVTKNVQNFSREQLTALMAPGVNHVAWPSDYAWTRWRLYFAFQEHHRDLDKLDFWHQFFTSTLFNVYLSPLHRDAYEWVMPGLADHPSILSPPPVDVDLWHHDGQYRGGTACTISGGMEFKGLHNHLDWAADHPHQEFTFYGGMRDHVNLPPNAEHTGRLPFPELIARVQGTEVYVELPSTAQPFNQTAVQGWLACSRVVTNELVGAAGYDWYGGSVDACRKALSEALPVFWTRLEEEVG